MITADEIRAKADRLYPRMVRAWLNGDSFFPHVLRSSKQLNDDIADNIAAVQALRSGSKEVRGFGYAVEWVERRIRSAGRNQVPQQIVFETQDDLLQLTGRQHEFAALASAVERIRATLPQLEDWIRSSVRQLTEVADIVDDLIAVTLWFREHPRPRCFAREIPLDVDTKFIERNRNVLRHWFDVSGVLPAAAIRSDETEFERRYGLRDKEPLVLTRFLDSAVQQHFDFPHPEVALPLSTLASLEIQNRSVFIVENKVNVRTFPSVSNAIVIFGSGYSAVLLRDLKWLHQNEVIYWGDIDVDGLQILSMFRRLIPNTRSLLMDLTTINQFRNLCGTGNGRTYETPALLTTGEEAAFKACVELNLRLEQERIRHVDVQRAVESLR